MRAKSASQQRSQQKRDRILRAMDALLKRKSFEEISVNELAAKAKVAPATIYQRFSNTDATASVLLELYYSKVEAWAQRPAKTADRPSSTLFDSLLALADNAYEQISELGYVMRPAYLYSRQRPERVGPEWYRLERAALAGFEAFLRSRSQEINVDDLQKTAGLVCCFFNFMLLGPLLHGEEPHWRTLRSRREFTRSLATMAHRYLTSSDGPKSG